MYIMLYLNIYSKNLINAKYYIYIVFQYICTCKYCVIIIIILIIVVQIFSIVYIDNI